MLKKIDLYIIKKYLSTFLFTVLIFTMIAVIIDFADKVEDFIEEDCTMGEILFDYYLNYVPYINGLLLPLYALISVIFFTSRMAYNSEIISILNAGVSFGRIIRPYLIAALLITGFHLLANHYIIPTSNKTRLDFEHTYIWKYSDKGKINNVHIFTDPTQKVYIKHYRKRDTTTREFRVEKIVDNQLVSVLKGKNGKWAGPPGKWELADYEKRTFNKSKEEIINGAGKKIVLDLNLTPEDFVRYQNQKEMMTTPELRDGIASDKRRGIGSSKEYEFEAARRTAEPFTILILTLIGVAVASRKVRGGMGLHLALGVALGASYIFLSKFSSTFATEESLPVLLGAWIPNLIFGVIAIILIFKAQK